MRKGSVNENKVWVGSEAKCVIYRYGVGWCGGVPAGPQLGAVWSLRFFRKSTMVHLGCTQIPGPPRWPRKCFILFWGQLHSSVCLPLPFDWPGMLERGMSTDCFKQNLAHYQLGGLFIGGGGRTKSTKGARSQRWLWKRPERVFKGNEHLYSTSKPPWNMTNSNRILISLVAPQSMAFVVKY